MEPSDERKETTPKDASADLDWNMLIEVAFAFEAQAEKDRFIAPEKLAESSREDLVELTLEIIKSKLPDDYSDPLFRKLSADEIDKLLAENADHPLIQFQIKAAAEGIGPAGDKTLEERFKKMPVGGALAFLIINSDTIVDKDVAHLVSTFLQRDGLPKADIKLAFAILESLSKEAQATTTEMLRKFSTHKSPEIRAIAKRIYGTAMRELANELLTAGHNTKPGEKMSPREQAIVDLKNELAEKSLKRRATEP